MKIGNWFSMQRDHTRMIQLDILRGVAILLVLFTHNIIGPQDSGALQPVLSYLRHLGPTGVDLFFVLSGFLVGGLLFKELRDTGHLDVGRFLIRRGFKIWPSYFVFIGFVFLWLFFIDHESLFGSIRALLPNLLHVQNYFGSPREHTWSLAVEEHFYLALPVLLLLLTSRQTSKFTSLPALPYIAVSLFILCALLRVFAYADRQPYNPHFATHLRIDSLFFGVMLAYFYHFKPQRLAFAARYRGKLIGLGTVMLLLFPALVISRSKLVGPIAFVMLYVAYGCFLLAIIYTQVGSGRLGAWLNSHIARHRFHWLFQLPDVFVAHRCNQTCGGVTEIRGTRGFATGASLALCICYLCADGIDCCRTLRHSAGQAVIGVARPLVPGENRTNQSTYAIAGRMRCRLYPVAAVTWCRKTCKQSTQPFATTCMR